MDTHIKQLVHVLVISRIDCRSILPNAFPVTTTDKLQRLHNVYAHVIMIRFQRDMSRPRGRTASGFLLTVALLSTPCFSFSEVQVSHRLIYRPLAAKSVT